MSVFDELAGSMKAGVEQATESARAEAERIWDEKRLPQIREAVRQVIREELAAILAGKAS